MASRIAPTHHGPMGIPPWDVRENELNRGLWPWDWSDPRTSNPRPRPERSGGLGVTEWKPDPDILEAAAPHVGHDVEMRPDGEVTTESI